MQSFTYLTILELSILDLKYSAVHSTGGPCGIAIGAKSFVFFMIAALWILYFENVIKLSYEKNC